jgi:Holliday junction resolvasome RuvABC DNA-binding subunit
VATFPVVPILAFEGLGPRGALDFLGPFTAADLESAVARKD